MNIKSIQDYLQGPVSTQNNVRLHLVPSSQKDHYFPLH